MTLLLKQLDIHGFKSFAQPTTFVFDRGITAVIGPNGSGKSNVAEALRWVLGEQGYANLRSRRTEDIIFAGSDKRAQMSMAEVILTLENSDGDLPLPFNEITISRRAYRTGENQYLINGNRVRLKDVHQLVAPLGQSYTIIGQGLVDIALSQRPEERRGLFEHAAGISGLRLHANEAERSLSEALGNAQRLRDILSELEPRVRSLERSARLAREYGSVRDRLHAMQRHYYASLWAQLVERLDAARMHLHERDDDHREQESLHQEAAQRVAALRAEERRLSDERRHVAEAITAHERALADARHRLALFDTQREAARTRLADLRTQLDEIERERTASIAEIERLSEEIAGIEELVVDLQMQCAEHEERLAIARGKRSEMGERLAHLDRHIMENGRTIAGIEGQRTALLERSRALEGENRQLAVAIDRDRERLADLQQAASSVDDRLTELQDEIARAELDIDRQDAVINAARERVSGLHSQIQAAERERSVLQHRVELLERSHAEGEGFYAGVRAVLRGVRKGDLSLSGLVGTLAETIEVPKQYEVAVEVALGGHLQDIIVERWSDAQVAIDFLKREKLGRATFQPLDTLRPARRPALNVRGPDCLGVAADLITFPEQIAVVVEQTLGRTLVVVDLDASHRILRIASGWTLVTLSGEITRPSGSVTGGGRTSEAGLLGRERERRTLPTGIRELADEARRLQVTLERENANLRDLELARGTHQLRLDDLRLQYRESAAELDRFRREITTLESDIQGLLQRERDHRTRSAEINAALESAEVGYVDAVAEVERLRLEREQLATQLASIPQNDDAVNELRTRIVAAQERARAARAAQRRSEERLEAAERRSASRMREIERMANDGVRDDRERKTIEADVSRLEGLVASSQGELLPLDQQRGDVANALARAEHALDRAAGHLREAERERDRATLNLARVRDEQVFLVERIRNDLDVDDPIALDQEIVEEGDVPNEQEISRLRERLRRMSVVGEDVLEQFEAESQRLDFLRSQLHDVDEAASGLRTVLAELNDRMTERFDETFRDVAAAFEQTFTRLFAGGSARLVLNTGDEGVSGIDIVAQPPGKRLQNLNALSGGERALTAVALLVAIQRVNPSPFCLLDEVDAALDESNVIRFRDEIRDLSGRTQFVIITHNRGTIEGANTLYGVTMGHDSVSRILSLRLDEAIRAVDEYDHAAIADG